MTKDAIIWMFKVLGVLTLSVLLWAVFIGRGMTIANLTAVDDTGEGTAVGPVYEQIMFGNDVAGFKGYLQSEWLVNSNHNGYWLDRQISGNWASIDTSDGAKYIIPLETTTP